MPDVTYFAESKEEAAFVGMPRRQFLEEKVFSERTIGLLQETRGSISLALGPDELDLVDIVRELNLKEIDVHLWPTLRDEDGYWNAKSNIAHTERHIHGLLDLIEKHRLKVRRIGVDLEPDISLARARWLSKLSTIWAVKKRTPPRAQQRFEHLIEEVQATGMEVESYEMKIGQHALVRSLLGMYRAPENLNERIEMLYRSYNHAASIKPSWRPYSLSKHATPAIGIVSGTMLNPGRDLGTPIDKEKTLGHTALVRDLGEIQDLGRDRFYVFALNNASVVEEVVDAWTESGNQRS
jgi:hypothetical protein